MPSPRLRVVPTARATRDGTASRSAPVGRTRELGVLLGSLDAALAGGGGLVLLVGEPGIGKTRLAEHLAREAERRDARVVWGRCFESDGAPPLWPWAMVLRALLAAGGEHGRRWLGGVAAVVAQVVPEVCENMEQIVPAPALSPEAARFRFFAAVADVLARAAAERPLVVVFDDLHWADGGSLQLLQLAVRQLAHAPVLFVGTYRDVEMRLAAESRLRAQLARLGELIPLGGLDAGAVSELVQSLVGRAPPAELVARVHALSEGNPFFVDALVRVALGTAAGDSLTQRLADLRVPEGIRDVVRERVRPLAPATRRLLAVAALFGREFAVPLLARAAGVTDDVVATALDEAGQLALVEAAAGGVRARFTHALIPDTLAADLPRAERATLHGRIGDVLAPLVEGGTAHVDAVATHFFEAAAAGRAEEAVAWARRAATDALARLGYEDAARHFRRALDLLDAGCPATPDTRFDLLFALGLAERWMGDTPAARATFRRAAEVARMAGDAERLARAALAHGGGLASFWDIELGVVDRDRVTLLQEALAGLGPAPTAPRALVEARLAAALAWSPAHRETVSQLGADAAAIAAQLGDERVLAAVAANRHWTEWAPDNLAQRLRDAADVVRLATRAGEPELVLQGLAFRAVDLLEAGDARAADEATARFAAIAEEHRQPRQLWWLHVYRGMRAHMAGRFDDMEAAAAAGVAVGQLAQPELAQEAFNAQHAMALLVLGRAAEVIPAVRAFAETGIPAWRCGLASLCVGAGDLEGARREVERVMNGGIEQLPRDLTWFFSLSRLAHAVHVLDDRASAAALYAQLEPFADKVGVLAYGVLCEGAIARPLGLLAATLGRADDAVGYLQRALEQNARIGAPALVTHTQYRLARVLIARDAAGDRARAHALLDEMERAAEGRNQLALRDAARAVRDGTGRPGIHPSGETDVCALRREGRQWLVTWQGRTARLRHTLGFEYLVTLLREPGRERHALELVAGGAPVPRSAAGDAGELLDAGARAAYRRRLDDLRVDLAEAETFNDPGRAARAQAEIDALTAELARAVGLGGRSRLAASAAERARLNVTRAIGKVIDWITAEHPALGRHLETHVRRGVFCVYTPDLRLPVRWDVPPLG